MQGVIQNFPKFWLTLPVSTPSDLQSLQELGEGLGHSLSKKAHSHGSDLWCNWEWIAVEMWIFVLKTVEVGL